MIPVRTNAAPVVSQRPGLKGFKKIHMFCLSSCFIETTIDTPDSEYGNVKSFKKLAVTYSDSILRFFTFNENLPPSEPGEQAHHTIQCFLHPSSGKGETHMEEEKVRL